MSFFSSIGKAIGGVAKSLTGGGGIGDLIKKGIGSLVRPFADKLSGLLTNSPFANIANKIIGFAGQIGPQMSAAGGPLGMLGGLLSKVGSLGSLSQIAQNLLGRLGGASALPAAGQSNLTDLFAQAQARLMSGILGGN